MSLYQPHHILITGGAGFIGSNFVRHLLMHDPQIKIFNLDLLTYAGSLANLENLSDPQRHTFIHGDIGDARLAEEIMVRYQIDTVVHFAAESHVDRSIHHPAPFIKTNVLGTFTLLEAARQFWQIEKKWDHTQCRFHHISTDEVYGALSAEDLPFSEQTPYAPNSPYSASKAAADHLVRAYFHTYQLPVTLSNCSNNYGPYQHREKLIPTIINACRENRSIPLYGDGSHIRDWLYVEDHCAAIQMILRHGKVGESYNIGGNHEINNLQVAKQICDLMDKFFPQHKSHHTLIQLVADRPGHDWRYAINITKLSQELGWQPQKTFASGLEKTIAFYCRETVNS